MNKVVVFLFCLFGSLSLEGIVAQNIDQVNRDFYDNSGNFFNAIPFDDILPNLLLNYAKGTSILEIGAGPGGLAILLRERGYDVTCLEPAKNLANMAAAKGLKVYPLTIQEFNLTSKYDSVVAISSLIHVPKAELPSQIKKIAELLNPSGHFFVSFIEGDDEGFEDPTHKGMVRFFAKWSEQDLDRMLSPYFELLESHKIYNPKMDRTFLLRVYSLRV